MCGVLRHPAVLTDITGVMTNKCPTDAIRGAGRPEATHMIEVDDRPARARAGHGPARAAAEELHPAVQPPATRPRSASCTTPATTRTRSTGCSSTSTLPRCAVRPRRYVSRASIRGIGFSTYTEICGLAPSRIVGPRWVGLQAAAGSPRPSASTAPGRRPLYTGTSPHGQGHETGFAQIVADRLGLDPSQVEVIHGDTQTGPIGLRHVRLALACRRRRGGAREPPTRSPQGQGDRRPSARGSARRTSSCATASSRCEDRPTRD